MSQDDNRLTKKNKLDELNRSLELLNSIQDNAAHAIISGSVDGTITSFNRKAEQMLGYQAIELVGKQTPAIFHDLDEVISRSKEFSKKLGYEVEAGYETFICHSKMNLKNEFEWTYIHKDGKKFPVLLSITAIRDNESAIIGYLGIAQDLSEQKILQNELVKKNNELELAQAIAKMGSWSFDVNEGRIIWSKQMFEIFPEDIHKGEPAFEAHKKTIHPKDVSFWEETVSACMNDGAPYVMRFRTYKKENPQEVVWVEARGQGVVENGKVSSISGTCQDITIHVLREEELESKAEALKKAEHAKSEFLANMSHEIRTPMNGIIGMLDILGDTELTMAQKDMLNTIAISSDALLGIISDVLDLSKIESGKLDLEKVSFNVNQLLENTSRLMQERASANGTTIQLVPIDQEPLWYIGDEGRIRQILVNFISNAVKFTVNGRVKIGCKLLAGSTDAARLKFYVEDNGIGIQEEHKQKLFHAFEQADSSITRKYGGTGLGLSICAKLASLMGGRVGCESNLGEGSTFYFELNLKKGPEIAATIKEKHSSELLAKTCPHKILLAEDNVINQKVAVMILEKLGYECDIANNGLEVLEIIKEKSIDHYSIILMDVQMPEMDGVSTTQKILEIWGDRAPNIIALTANAFNTDKENCLNAGMIDYLSKPLKVQSLREILVKHSQKKK